ncbi:MAG: hypothetical protein ABOJ95_001450 [Wolbachia endosymbiont of Armadillidium vulgare]|uniref:hypothetical protein n=1 Tax=Wolbachia endosymbiont of Armadillidium vulgare TaxID=77039 RepID=UPI001EE6CEE1|nr:hypothetical protein [Wolbachia endosymbiont of Armadillidium vulgare]
MVHCKTRKQAEFMKVMIEERLAKCKLKLHPEKTHIVYSKDDDRREEFPTQSFDFLGYTFRPRIAKNKMRNYFVSFLPAICNKAKKKIKKTIKSWRIHRITWITLENIEENRSNRALLHHSREKNWQLLTKFTIKQAFNLRKKNMPTKMKISNCHEYNRFLQERGNIFHFINGKLVRK